MSQADGLAARDIIERINALVFAADHVPHDLAERRIKSIRDACEFVRLCPGLATTWTPFSISDGSVLLQVGNGARGSYKARGNGRISIVSGGAPACSVALADLGV